MTNAMSGPLLYQVNTRVLLNELGPSGPKSATLDDVPESWLVKLAADGFEWLWLMGVWQTGPLSQHVARQHPDMQAEYLAYLPEVTAEDIVGSPFAVAAYQLHADFGDPGALARFRRRLQRHGLKLMLDFVPNHTGLDHRWARDNPEYYIQATPAELAAGDAGFMRVETTHGPKMLAHGKDPYFPCWTDTLQLNYRHQGLQLSMTEQLLAIAEMCDGLRCDMAMLLLPDVIGQTWGEHSLPADGSLPINDCFWDRALARVHARHPEFLFLAEVYWDREYELQQRGFDYTYDKRLYDRLRARQVEVVRGHLHADLAFQRKLARFLENHDEPRAAAVFPGSVHFAAAVVTFFLPGLRLLHDGQLMGLKTKQPLQMARRKLENDGQPDRAIARFYDLLLAAQKHPALTQGQWQLLEAQPAWESNPTWLDLLAGWWQNDAGDKLLTVVNFAPCQGQGYVLLPDHPHGLGAGGLRGQTVQLVDLLSDLRYTRRGDELAQKGLYVDLPPWGYHVFAIQTNE